MNRSQRTMSVAKLTRLFRNGDETSWADERTWLETNHADRLAELQASITHHGIYAPIRLDYDERRVIDGHHRVVVAQRMGLTRVPVADAWDGSDWPVTEMWT